MSDSITFVCALVRVHIDQVDVSPNDPTFARARFHIRTAANPIYIEIEDHKDHIDAFVAAAMRRPEKLWLIRTKRGVELLCNVDICRIMLKLTDEHLAAIASFDDQEP